MSERGSNVPEVQALMVSPEMMSTVQEMASLPKREPMVSVPGFGFFSPQVAAATEQLFQVFNEYDSCTF